MKQETFTDIEYSFRKKKTKREEFLEIMDEIIPWDEWANIIRPYYPVGTRGRPFNLSDPGTEDAIYDSYAMRKFVGIDFMKESVPDEMTLLNFRHLLEERGLNKLFFDAIKRVMDATGHIMHGGTIVDATIIDAPSSTKNGSKARDPEMHQTRKGKDWRFGMKCHVGVDAGTGLVHTIDYRVNRRTRSLPKYDNVIDWERYIEHRKSSERSKVGHIFRIIKCQFGYRKTAYRGLGKKENRLYAMFACANLYMLALAGRKLSTI